MVDLKRLFIPSIEKVIALLIIFAVTSINTTFDYFRIGFPYTYYSCGGNTIIGYYCLFSNWFLILDILIIYFLICLAFYPKLIQINETDSTLRKIIIPLINFILKLIIFVIISFIFLVFTEDISNLDDLPYYR